MVTDLSTNRAIPPNYLFYMDAIIIIETLIAIVLYTPIQEVPNLLYLVSHIQI